VYLINNGPSVPSNCGILEEAWTNKEVNLNHLRTFGSISYVHVKLDRRSKLDLKSKRRIFIGYGTSEYAYQFWDPANRNILKYKDVEEDVQGLADGESTSEKDPGVAPRSTPE